LKVNDNKIIYLKNYLLRNSLTRLLDDMPVPSNSILSWKDQVKKENIKILEPTIVVRKEEKVKTYFVK